ncbi:pseudouridine synthase, partial [Mesorhizobium sp. M5C.F.Ca.IN.020.32.2.1]
MDDKDKKFPRQKGPRKNGPKPSGPRGRDTAAGKGGKPSFGAKKPYAPRGDRPMAADGERPKRDFKSGDRPIGKGPRPEGKPYEKREGPRKPYAPRGDRPIAADGERPKRDFKSGDRPFGKGPRPEGKPYEKREGPRKPYAPRGDRPAAAEGERNERRFDRPKGDFSDRPKRDFAGDRHQGASAGGFKPRPRPAEATEEAGERIAKRLARAGLASRRDAEELIAAGRVKVNGRVLSSPAFNVMPGDIIHLDGMEIPPIERTRLFLFHKPAGVVTTNRDPEGRKTVFDVLPAELPRLMTIGRLDINTEGLLLLTNDGGLARVLELPATGWLRRYRVRVHGKVEESALAGLREGIAVDGVFYGAIEATLDREQGTNAWLTLGLREGKNREVRNILGSLGLDVTRLIRISYGPFQLDDLPEGHVLEIKGRVLRDQLG